MMSTKTKARVGAKAAKTIIEEPLLRSAVSEVAPPIAKLGVDVGKRRLKRRTRKQLAQIGDTVGTVANLAQNYAPQAAQAAQQLGLVEPVKTKRTLPRVLAGVALGASLTLLLEPGTGRQRRDQVRRLFGRAQQAAS
jgi:hypothetical protein